MVAILFAAFSMAATVVAIFRHKADLERPMSHVGIEGMMVITVRCDGVFASQKKGSQKKFFFWGIIETNCYFISTAGPFGLFNHSIRHWHRFILL